MSYCCTNALNGLYCSCTKPFGLSTGCTTHCPDGETCETIYSSDCILYTGPDVSCYGITNGMNITEIVEILIGYFPPCNTTTTSSTTTTTIISPFGYGMVTNSVCIQTFTNYIDPSPACLLAQSTNPPNGDCLTYYYNETLCPTLTVGCILYTDQALTNPISVTPGNYYSNGVNYFQFDSNGVITDIGLCPQPPSYCSSFVRPLIDGTPFNVNGVSTTCTYTGDVETYPYPATPFLTSDIFPADSPWLGRNSNLFSLTFNFSSPVNNVSIYQMGGDISESYLYTTNGGPVILTSSYLYNASIVSGDTVEVYSFPMDGSGVALVTVNAPLPYTTLTISGYVTPPGQPLGPFGESSNGSLFAICLAP